MNLLREVIPGWFPLLRIRNQLQRAQTWLSGLSGVRMMSGRTPDKTYLPRRDHTMLSVVNFQHSEPRMMTNVRQIQAESLP